MAESENRTSEARSKTERVAALSWVPKLSPFAVIVAAMLLLGVFLRVNAFGYPNAFMFDEHHFVENARNYLHQQPDQNDHPPMGKLIIAQSIRLLGDNSVAWRIPSLIWGFITILAVGFGTGRLFSSARAGWLAAAFVSVDGFLSGYARAALLDGFLAGSLALMFLITSFSVNFWVAVAAGAIAGFAISVKFSGVGAVVPFALILLLSKTSWRKRLLYGGIFSALLVLVYVAQFAVGLATTDRDAGLIDVFVETRRLFVHHAALTDMKNPLTSGWITWAIPLRSIVLSYSQHIGIERVLSSLGNPALWWPGVLLTIGIVGIILTKGISATLHPSANDLHASNSIGPNSFVHEHGRVILLLLSGCFAFLAPWVMTHRDSYIYHFLPCYVSILMLLAGYVDRIRSIKPRGFIAYLAIVLVVAAFYAPVWSMMDTSKRVVNTRLFLRGWR